MSAMRNVAAMVGQLAHGAAPLVQQVAALVRPRPSEDGRVAGPLYFVGAGVHRAAGLFGRYAGQAAQLGLSKRVAILAEMLAPESIWAESTSTIDNRPQSHLLVIGKHDMENLACLVHAADRGREMAARLRATVPVEFLDEGDFVPEGWDDL